MMVNPRERNQRMKSLFGNVDPEALVKQPSPPPLDPEKRRVGSAAVKSMDRAFVSIEEENKRLHDQLIGAETVVELDPSTVIPSFVNDRLDIEGDPNFEAFVEGIRDFGQKLPILVRPVHGRPGYYQAAYGHRRLRACKQLQRPVKAIIREMSDEELVVSQGIENSERLNLSFIEQGLFALALKDRGYTRETIANALGRQADQKISYISTLTNTTAMIPEDLIRKIGSAPAIGRPKWEKLGRLIERRSLSASQVAAIQHLMTTTKWNNSDSDKRFDLVLTAFDVAAATQADTTEVTVADGVVISIKRSTGATRISVPDNKIPGLSAWLLQRLPSLVKEFQVEQEKGTKMT